VVGGDDVEVAVAVEVGRGQVVGLGADVAGRVRQHEGAVGVAQVDADAADRLVGGRQVDLGVVVEVCGGDGVGLGGGRVRGGGGVQVEVAGVREGAVAVAQKDADVVAVEVDRGQIDVGVVRAVQNAHRHPAHAVAELVAGVQGRLHLEGAVAVAQQDVDGVAV